MDGTWNRRNWILLVIFLLLWASSLWQSNILTRSFTSKPYPYANIAEYEGLSSIQDGALSASFLSDKGSRKKADLQFFQAQYASFPTILRRFRSTESALKRISGQTRKHGHHQLIFEYSKHKNLDQFEIMLIEAARSRDFVVSKNRLRDGLVVFSVTRWGSPSAP